MILLGSLSCAAYGQYTNSVILLNLAPSTLTYVVQVFYSLGILCSYCLMITPTFKILSSIPSYHRLPDPTCGPLPRLKSLLTRVLVVLLCCSLAYQIPNLGQFLNFQGSVTGILMTFVLPIAVYLKAYGERVSVKERRACYAILAFGVAGGAVSATYALEALVREE